ncbi:MAG: TlpA family protein disulfide reductase [Candidatus Brocadiaceae bacterium]|nr:TlpA family protein disulfide reductase [Candidatus Brocadiaceae bacterium]
MDKYSENCSPALREKIIRLKKLAIGQVAPDIVLPNPDGKMIPLSSLIGSNVVMVYFWASWCNGCEEENPNIAEIYNKYQDRGFAIYSVSLDSDKKEWLKAIEKHQFTWTNVCDLKEWESETVETYSVNKTPAIYLLNREGRIMSKNIRGKALEMKVREFFP